MKAPLLWLGLVGWASSLAFARPCDGAHASLAAISRKLSRGDFEHAARELAPLAKSYPNCPALLLAQARLQAMANDSPEADDLFIRYTALQPDDPGGYGYYARFLLSRREYQRADKVASQALEKDPSNPIALAVSGQILAMKGQTKEGLDMLAQACQLDPDDAESQFQMGTIYDRLKRPADAAQHFQKAVDLNPRDARAWDYLALSLEPLGETSAAQSAYQKAGGVDQQGPFFDAFLDYNYGRFLMKRGDLTASKAHLDRAVELVPEVRAVWYERAKLNLRMKNYGEARSDAEKAAALADPAGIIIDLQLYALLEQIYRRLGETALANKYAQLSRDTPPPMRKADR
jgi:tetratricopeptide (TPR) repeat protein